METLTTGETARYSRHLLLPEVGVEGQRRLKNSRVLLVGAGGLGAPASLYLAAAGVGRIGLVDFDAVEFSNLQRQILYATADVGRPKLEAAGERLRGLNPEVDVVLHDARLTSANALEIVRDYQVVVDGTDNFATRYLVNDACVLLDKPNVYGSIFRFEGQASVFHAGVGPCYRCLYPEPPPPGLVPSCAEGGVLGVLPGIVGAIQANEAIKLLLGLGEPLIGRLLLLDALEMRFRELRLRRDPDCPVCGERPTQHGLIDYDAFCGVRGEAFPAPARADGGEPDEIGAKELAARIERGDPPVLVDVRSPQEWQICRLEGATLIPMPALPERAGELDPGADIVVYCHLGIRSVQAAEFLRGAGFRKVRHLRGGTEAWAREVDPTMPRY